MANIIQCIHRDDEESWDCFIIMILKMIIMIQMIIQYERLLFKNTHHIERVQLTQLTRRSELQFTRFQIIDGYKRDEMKKCRGNVGKKTGKLETQRPRK